MRIKEGQIFNLMDTNGRRNDVINALQGYLTILDDIQNEQKMNWASMPESLAQYEFYRQANVVIMPVNTDELSSLIDKSSEYDEIISKVHKLFEVDKINFDIEWREKFMGAII